MKLLALGLAALLAAPAFAQPSSSRAGKPRAASPGARRGSFAQQTSGGGAAGVKGNSKVAADVPGWLARPTPGALIRTAGEGYKISDGGGDRTNLDYAATAKDWGSMIATNALFAVNTTGVGMQVGPKDKAPYPAGSGGGGAGGNGITTNGTVMGLDAGGNTIATQGH